MEWTEQRRKLSNSVWKFKRIAKHSDSSRVDLSNQLTFVLKKYAESGKKSYNQNRTDILELTVWFIKQAKQTIQD